MKARDQSQVLLRDRHLRLEELESLRIELRLDPLVEIRGRLPEIHLEQLVDRLRIERSTLGWRSPQREAAAAQLHERRGKHQLIFGERTIIEERPRIHQPEVVDLLAILDKISGDRRGDDAAR